MTPDASRFALHPRPPFRLDTTVVVLRRNTVNAVDRWDPDASIYRRVLVVDGSAVEVAVESVGTTDAPQLTVSVAPPESHGVLQQAIARLLRLMLGLDVDLEPFYRGAAREEWLAPLVSRFPGLKPPVMPTVFEALVSGIACQQLSLVAGMHVLGRLSSAYGAQFGGHHAFPRPDDLVRASAQDLRGIGFSTRKAQTILRLAENIEDGRLDLEGLARLDTDEVTQRLCDLPGIGRWTAQSVALRAMHRLDTFPTDDVGGRNNLQRLLGLPGRPDLAETQAILERWRPYQGLVYFYLLLDGLSRGVGRASAQRDNDSEAEVG
jgi:DNA-3-methyladenine glycosylase II